MPFSKALLNFCKKSSGSFLLDTQQAKTNGRPVNFFHSSERSYAYLNFFRSFNALSPITMAPVVPLILFSKFIFVSMKTGFSFHHFSKRISASLTDVRD